MSQPVLDLAVEKELSPLTIIRTETALSRFPVHRLAKKGVVQIEIKNQATALLWEVTYNSKYGQPGPLAYKLDTLVINRRIETAGRPVPPTLKLGSLAQIAGELGLKRDTNSVKTALLQNAFAAVNAKIRYKAIDRTERTLEAAFTRYAVVFTGETLPDGKTADAVYLVFHPIYADVLNAAVTRPLDYDYMKTLPPSAQRFYEVVSYQIYAALHFQNERAKLRYSDYCLLSTATRYLDFDHVKKQMYKVHRPHMDSGYLAKVSYEETTDSDGQPDWWIFYVPGPNASREYQKFTSNTRKADRAGKRSAKEVVSPELPFLAFAELGTSPELVPASHDAEAAVALEQEEPKDAAQIKHTADLIEALVGAELNRADAARFARESPEECRRQLAYLPYVAEFRISRGAYIRRAIEQGFAPPAAYLKEQKAKEAESKKQEEAERRRAAEVTRRAVDAQKAAQTASAMERLEIEAPGAFMAFTAYAAEQRQQAAGKLAGMSASIRARMIKIWEAPEKGRELFEQWQALPKEAQAAFPPHSKGKKDTQNITQDETENRSETIRALIQASLQDKPKG